MNIPCPRIPHPRMADTVTATLPTAAGVVARPQGVARYGWSLISPTSSPGKPGSG
jgi:hypothetical protein